MTKKKTKKSKAAPKGSFLKKVIWVLAAIIVMIALFILGYVFGANKAKQSAQQRCQEEKQKRLELLHRLEQSTQLKEVLKKESPKYISASHEIDDETLANPPHHPIKAHKKKPQTQVNHTSKPKLAIIIDDVSTASQIRAIKSLHIPLTMSFLPPSNARPHSAELASHEKFYMVHLPMEAMHFNKEEPYTLRVSDSQHEILQRVQKIKNLFPRVHYINNHTGSKFTADTIAMNRLIYAFNKYHIKFIDSRTTARTKAPQVLKKYGLKYVPRDVFLDHHMDKAYVKEQIKKAVALAKKRGHAIAIGHPHKNTLEALYESKQLLKQVQLVQVNKIY